MKYVPHLISVCLVFVLKCSHVPGCYTVCEWYTLPYGQFHIIFTFMNNKASSVCLLFKKSTKGECQSLLVSEKENIFLVPSIHYLPLIPLKGHSGQ